ncbi:MAG: CBS domain-containing protein [Sphingopyxis sp.]|jgi:CBS domain-containing protein|nr:CBS domain-containing protein [Sphingopyxis sp.]
MTIKVILASRDGSIYSAQESETVATVIARLTEHRIGAVPVVRGGEVVGIFSERDVIRGLQAHGAAVLERTMADVMTSPAITVDPDVTALGALSLMTKRRIRHLPVVSGGALVGFVSIGDLVKHRIESIEKEAAAMREYIAGA